MNKRIVLFLGLSLGLGEFAHAQEIEDMARYSGLMYQGTARSTAAGNAFGAVGADYGGIGINPAGLGLYRKSEFMLTAGFNDASSNGNYLGSNAVGRADNFNIGNIGLVIANPKHKRDGTEVQDGWVSTNWAIGMNRTNNFNTQTVIQGNNTNNSILYNYRDDANNQNLYPSQLKYGTLGFMGYQAYLIDPFDSTHYVPRSRFDNKLNVSQRDIINTSGASNAINLTFAGNYSNRLYIGGSISVPVVDFTSVRTFTETNLNPIDKTIPQYRSATQVDSFNTSGVGITASIGAIYRISEMFRVGLSFQLPTYYGMTDNYSRSVTGVTRDTTVTVRAGNDGGFNYSLVTPGRITASAAFFFSKNGFISADYEYVDYSASRFNSASDAFIDVNQSAQNSLASVSTIRVGGEYRVDQFAFRAGYNYISSPYKAGLTDAGYTAAYNIYSAGVGFRDKNSSIDLGFQYLQTNSTYTPYTLNDGSAASANISLTRTNLMLTYSTRF